MKKLILFIFLFTSTLLLSSDGIQHKKMPLSFSLPLLEQIEDKAMQLGTGKTKAYVFLDPLCPHSRNFLSMIYESEKMRSLYHYYIFLYSLERFDSEEIVNTIYSSSSPLQSTLEVMVNKKKLPLVTTKKADLKISDISHIASKLDVYKRPYLILVKKPKKRKNK